MVVFILLGLLVLFAAIGVPLAFAIGASSVSFLAIDAPNFLMILPQKLWGGAYSELLIALPLFMLAGELMNSGGITDRIIKFCLHLVRPIHGGLGEVNVVASMIFGGITGSSVADTSALGSILIPAMEKNGYPKSAASGITVASSTMGMIIPPSIPMIVYAMISGASIGGLFIAGLVPGVLIGVSQIALVYIISRKKGWHPAKEKLNWGQSLKDFFYGLPALIMPVLIVLSVSFGIATATESAAIAAVYALFLGFLVYRELTWKQIWRALKNAFKSSAAIMLIVAITSIFTWILSMYQVPQLIQGFFLGLNVPAWTIGLMFVLIILIFGTFIDVVPAITLLTPILFPVMTRLGFSPLQFGAMMITGLAVGLVTPPIGMCLNACHRINKMPILDIFKGAVPYIICNLLVLIAVTLIPALTTWLPTLIRY